MTVKEIERELKERPELMEFMKLASELSEEDHALLCSIMENLTKRRTALGTLAEAVVKLQNVVDDVILTNRLELTMDHSKSVEHNRDIIDGFRKERAQWIAEQMS